MYYYWYIKPKIRCKSLFESDIALSFDDGMIDDTSFVYSMTFMFLQLVNDS